MQITPEAQRILADLARRHGISPEAAQAVFRSLAAHGGTMAQFDHPDLGGMGQWLRGGMTMVGDMFNGRMKQHVDALCSDLADALQRMGPGAAGPASGAARPDAQSRTQSQAQSQGWSRTGEDGRPEGGPPGPGFAAEDAWWPVELGAPSSSGAQDHLRYALFPAARRLAVRRGGHVELYDTGGHRIFGVSQGGGDPVFSGDKGTVRLSDLLPVGTGAQAGGAGPGQAAAPGSPAASVQADPLALIERLAELRQKGVLTDEEFKAKKTELLGRL